MNHWESQFGHTCGPEGLDYENYQGCMWDEEERHRLEDQAQQEAEAEAFADWRSSQSPW